MTQDIENSILVFDQVSKRYIRDANRRFVLGKISFSLKSGEILRIRGDSGSGKTTVLRIAGLLTVPDRGSVHVCGEEAASEKNRDRLRAACIGIVFQNANLFDHLTVLQNLLVADQGNGNREECLEMLARFNIQRLANVKAGRISGGELQRAGICRALINRPRLLLLDEPTSSLDDAAADEVASVIRMLSERGVAILLASHDPRLDGLETKSLRLEAGKVVMS
ncbi:ABC transporter ATP-binding protein [Bifidobacterium oedipodis]|uniref:ABC transporter ATP-binding protein YxdL n=1 Tax=Bifidobacterium oedipodis TaxID=2675322 RepID=A0A7Y0HS20_9BIFI|nr:ATP-binding cassette domain-containing protein [Bifidobacterium sp. DSM 109957]NMM94695.1 ABC transporter ATP-binding protein YxdL [Bifidobacterium sp. DSM 109957]